MHRESGRHVGKARMVDVAQGGTDVFANRAELKKEGVKLKTLQALARPMLVLASLG